MAKSSPRREGVLPKIVDVGATVRQLVERASKEAHISAAFKENLKGEVVYGLPEQVIDALREMPPAKRTRSTHPSPLELEYETDIARICHELGCVGWRGKFTITHDYVVPEWIPALPISKASMRGKETLRTLRERREGVLELLTAYLGWLITEPTFQNELAKLRAEWPTDAPLPQLRPLTPSPPGGKFDFSALEVDQKTEGGAGLLEPATPEAIKRASEEGGSIHIPEAWMRKVSPGTPPYKGPLPPEIRGVTFCARWCLMKLSSWDLPDPLSILFSGGIDSTLQTVSLLGMGKVLFVPATLRHGENFDVGGWVNEEAREPPANLRGWMDVLAKRPKKKVVAHTNKNNASRPIGLKGYQEIILLSHILRVLRSRYPGLGQKEQDEVAGLYIGSTATVPKLRTALKQHRRHQVL